MQIIKNILDCLEQKSLLMTECLNLTKQIEVQSKQEEVNADELVNKRQVLIDRMKKCDLLIKKLLEEIENPQVKELWQVVLSNNEIQTDDEFLKKAIELNSKINGDCNQIIALNNLANENFKSALNTAKQNLIETRKNNNGNRLYL